MKATQVKHNPALRRAIKLLIYSSPKAGKTQIAGDLAKLGFRLIWVDMENGHETLFKMPDEALNNIELVLLPDTRDYPIAIETCLKMTKGAVNICNAHGKVDCMLCKKAQKDELSKLDAEDVEGSKEEIAERFFTYVDLRSLGPRDIVVFDSGTQLANSTIAHITKDEDDTYKPTYDDWGNMGKLLDVFYSRIQNAPYNVIVLTHEMEVEMPGKKTKLVPVGGTRNFSRNVAKYFGHVVHLELTNKKHTAASSSTFLNTVLTGSRTDVAVENLKEPSLIQFFDPEAKPELKQLAVPGAKRDLKSASTSASSTSTQDILAKLKNKAGGA